ncbi:MAG: CBS domain-containing protein, partial [Cyanobacteria bacterium]|nr:CBS domain-containing protein [Cyanobacteriota bacterium]
ERQKLRMLLNEEHPADIAEYIDQMEPSHRLFCFRLLDLEHASAVLAELEGDRQAELLKSIGDLAIVPIISHMSPDDAVDLLAELPEETATAIIEQIPDMEAKADLEQLLQFDSDTAGGIMSTDYLSLFARMSVGDALVELRDMYVDLEEDIYDIYVVDEENRLVGRVTVKELLTADPVLSVESVMEEDVAQVLTSTDQEEAADVVGHYDLLTLPVTDVDGKLCGIITADDVMDVLWEEATEDIYHSTGRTGRNACL